MGIKSPKDVQHYVKGAVTKNPKTNYLEIEKLIYEENDGKLSYFPTSAEIKQYYNKWKQQIKLSDFELLRGSKTLKQEIFFRKIIIDEKHVIAYLASDLMIKRFSIKGAQAFIDGYFKVPNPFYQLVTIYIYEQNQNFYGPAMFMLLDSKEEKCYKTALFNLKNLLSDISHISGMDVTLCPKIIVSDFEIGLMNAIKSSFPDAIIKGCHAFFILFRHYGEKQDKKV